MKVYAIKKDRHKKGRVLITIILIIAIIVVAVCAFISKNVNPMILSISNERIRAITSDAVSRSVLQVMSENPSSDYLKIERDEKNSIKSVELDSAAISDLAQKITIDAQKKINDAGAYGIKIPIGSLSGVTLLTGLGPDINIRIFLVGSTQTSITSIFSETGINQTLHRLYLDISGSVAVAVPGLQSNIKISNQVLMSETIIVGEVPPTYLKAVNVGDMLDLVVD